MVVHVASGYVPQFQPVAYVRAAFMLSYPAWVGTRYSRDPKRHLQYQSEQRPISTAEAEWLIVSCWLAAVRAYEELAQLRKSGQKPSPGFISLAGDMGFIAQCLRPDVAPTAITVAHGLFVAHAADFRSAIDVHRSLTTQAVSFHAEPLNTIAMERIHLASDLRWFGEVVAREYGGFFDSRRSADLKHYADGVLS